MLSIFGIFKRKPCIYLPFQTVFRQSMGRLLSDLTFRVSSTAAIKFARFTPALCDVTERPKKKI